MSGLKFRMFGLGVLGFGCFAAEGIRRGASLYFRGSEEKIRVRIPLDNTLGGVSMIKTLE